MEQTSVNLARDGVRLSGFDLRRDQHHSQSERHVVTCNANESLDLAGASGSFHSHVSFRRILPATETPEMALTRC